MIFLIIISQLTRIEFIVENNSTSISRNLTLSMFGKFIHIHRLLKEESKPEGYSLRWLATNIDVSPSYLSKIEREVVPPPSNEKIIELAEVLEINPDVLLSLAGRIREERRLFLTELFSALEKDADDQQLMNLLKEIRNEKRQK